MDGNQDQQTIDLRDYVAVLRARRFTILLVIVLVVGAAIGLSFMQEPRYTAESRVLVDADPLPTGSTAVPPPVNLETQREIAASEPVTAMVIDELGLDRSIDSVLSGLNVQGVTETEVLRISYTSTDPEFARDAANLYAAKYIEFRKDRALRTITSDEDAIQERVDSASDELGRIEQDLQEADDANDDALVSTLETQRNVLIARLGVLQQRLDDVQAERSSGFTGGQIIEEAELPTAPSSPNYTTNAILGVILGLALGIGIAFLRERLDDRFRGRDDVEKVLGAPVLATVPRFRQDKKEDSPALTALTKPKGTTSEVYRGLRTNLQFISSQRGIKSALVTSSSAAEGKTVTAANLAVVLAQAGSRVILVSADMRRPTLEKHFKVGRGDKGLSTLLMHPGQELWSVIQDPGIPNLRILPSGPLPPNPAELLTSPNLTQLIDTLEANADFVIIDTPPVLAVADATIIASRVGGVVLVIDATTTHRTATTHAKEELERVGGRFVGAVLNNFDTSTSPYYYGPYTYYATDEEEVPEATDNGSATETEKPKRRIFQRN